MVDLYLLLRTSSLSATLALAAQGCAVKAAYPADYRVSISPRFSPAVTTDILNALDDWRAHVPVTFHVAIGPCQEVGAYVCLVPSLSPPCDGDGLIVEGCTSVDGHSQWMVPDGIEMRNVAAHEIGHAMGLRHDRRGTIMCTSLECEMTHVTEEDARQWRELR